jgi:hypothetical protein
VSLTLVSGYHCKVREKNADDQGGVHAGQDLEFLQVVIAKQSKTKEKQAMAAFYRAKYREILDPIAPSGRNAQPSPHEVAMAALYMVAIGSFSVERNAEQELIPFIENVVEDKGRHRSLLGLGQLLFLCIQNKVRVFSCCDMCFLLFVANNCICNINRMGARWTTAVKR